MEYASPEAVRRGGGAAIASKGGNIVKKKLLPRRVLSGPDLAKRDKTIDEGKAKRNSATIVPSQGQKIKF